MLENLYKQFRKNSNLKIDFNFYENLPPNWRARLGMNKQSRLFFLIIRSCEKHLNLTKSKKSTMDIRLLGYHFDPSPQLYEGIPLVSLVYDFIPERLPEFFGGISPHLQKLSILGESNLAVCISKETERDLRIFVPNFRGESIVIPLASKFPIDAISSMKLPTTSKYLLYVGRRDSYKNVNVLLESLTELKEYDLVLFGGGELSEEEILIVGDSNINRVHCTEGPDSFLQKCYMKASYLIYPSKLEGFGLPILEAISVACPVIASDISVFRELFGDAVTYFHPESAHELVNAIRYLNCHEENLKNQKEMGLSKASEYTWERAAEILAKALQNLAISSESK